MKIDIKATNLEITPALAEFINEKIGSLDKFVRGGVKGGDGERGTYLVEAYVEVARDTKHHKHGEVFKAEVNLKIGGRVLRAERSEWDARAAIDGVREELKMILEKEQGKLESKFRRGARSFKKLISISPLARFRRKH